MLERSPIDRGQDYLREKGWGWRLKHEGERNEGDVGIKLKLKGLSVLRVDLFGPSPAKLATGLFVEATFEQSTWPRERVVWVDFLL